MRIVRPSHCIASSGTSSFSVVHRVVTIMTLNGMFILHSQNPCVVRLPAQDFGPMCDLTRDAVVLCFIQVAAYLQAKCSGGGEESFLRHIMPHGQ